MRRGEHPGLLERDHELDVIEALLGGLAQGSSGVLFIEGPPGIGKTELLRAAIRNARRRELTVLAARADEMGHDVPLAVVRELFSRAMKATTARQRSRMLAGPAAEAASLFEPSNSEAQSTDQIFSLVQGLYWLTANLAGARPVVIIVDDCHRADAASLRFLLYLAGRLDGLRVAVVIAADSGQRAAERGALTQLAQAGIVLTPKPLGAGAVAAILRDVTAAEPDPEFVRSAHRVTGGNPFLVNQLAESVLADNIPPTSRSCALIEQLGPRTVARATLLRLSRMSERGAALARAAAVLGTGPRLRHAAALAGMDQARAARAADALRAGHVLESSRELRFVHSIVRSAIYADIPAGQRALWHGQAAALLANEHAPVSQIAAHLQLSEPSGDPAVSACLCEAAEIARGGGLVPSAVALLRRALDEPPPPDTRPRILLELGTVQALAREPAAPHTLQTAYALLTDPVQRAEAALAIASQHLHAGDLQAAGAQLAATEAELSGIDADLRARLLTLRLAVSALETGSQSEFQALLGELSELGAESPRAARGARLYHAVAGAMTNGDRAQLIRELDQSLDRGRFIADETADAWPLCAAVAALVALDALDAASELVEAMLEDSRLRGSILGVTASCALRALIRGTRGELSDAHADLRSAVELADRHDLRFILPMVLACGKEVLLERPDAWELVTTLDVEQLLPPGRRSAADAMWLYARGAIRLHMQKRAEAIEDLRASGDLWLGLRVHNPNVASWRSSLALALGAGSQSIKLASEELELAKELDSPRATGVALRALGLLSGGEEGLRRLQQAVQQHERAGSRLELARSLLEHGGALRRANQRSAARDQLRIALDLTSRCGATNLSERCRQELRAAGGRIHRAAATGVDSLTSSELRVVQLAASGLGNRHIAQALFVSLNTVESHLRSAYRKLEITSRAALHGILSAQGPEARS